MHDDAAITGRIAWRRYALFFVPGLGVATTMLVMSAQGALAASLAISGLPFKLSASAIDATGFSSYTSIDTDTGGKKHSVTPAGFKTAELTNLCQSIVSPSPLGDVTMKLTAGGNGTPVHAENMVADFDELSGDVTFTTYAGGVDASRLTGGTSGPKGEWGQQAAKMHIDNYKSHTYATTAGVFVLKGLKINVSFGKNECY